MSTVHHPHRPAVAPDPTARFPESPEPVVSADCAEPVEPVVSAEAVEAVGSTAMTVRRSRTWPLLLVGVGISLLLAAVVSFYASGAPDGLNKVAADIGFGEHAQDSATAASPVADYEAGWIADDRLAVAVAGIVGVLLTGALAFSLFLWLGRRSQVDVDHSQETHGPPGTTTR